jgi:hypothetical protein
LAADAAAPKERTSAATSDNTARDLKREGRIKGRPRFRSWGVGLAILLRGPPSVYGPLDKIAYPVVDDGVGAFSTQARRTAAI